MAHSSDSRAIGRDRIGIESNQELNARPLQASGVAVQSSEEQGGLPHLEVHRNMEEEFVDLADRKGRDGKVTRKSKENSQELSGSNQSILGNTRSDLS